ncbi:heat shock protein 60A-like [Teleopsis dalmanni]|uniref:heat shock protein 60A-like n=1 Tax=Teleopsis dalmanni TaxID=139649 RepID=UPI0018CD8F44|nr:heat shock protein 60A-like [Teleopsis dalmanni]
MLPLYRSYLRAVINRHIIVRHFVKNIRFVPEIRKLMSKEVGIFAKPVQLTSDRRGRNVIIKKPGKFPIITSSDHTVNKSIALAAKQNAGELLVQNMVNSANGKLDDKTFTTTVADQVKEKMGLKKLCTAVEPVKMHRGFILAVNTAKQILKAISHPISIKKGIAEVVTISVSGDKSIASLIYEALAKVKSNGAIIVEYGDSLTDKLELTKCLKFESGHKSMVYKNSVKGDRIQMQDEFILFGEKDGIVPALKLPYKQRQPFDSIAEGICGQAVRRLAINRLQYPMPQSAVRASCSGNAMREMLIYVAVFCAGIDFGHKARLYTLEAILFNDLCKIGKVIVSLLKSKGNKVEFQDHIGDKKQQIILTKPILEIDKLQGRLRSPTNDVAFLRICDSSEVNNNGKMIYGINALNMTCLCTEKPIVSDEGSELLSYIPTLNGLKGLNEDQLGMEIVHLALRIASTRIAKNTGADGAIVVALAENGFADYGHDALYDEYGDVIEKGRIDPTKVLRTVFPVATGMGSLLAKAEAVVVGHPELKDLCSGVFTNLVAMYGNNEMGGGAVRDAVSGVDVIEETNYLYVLKGKDNSF